MLMNLMPSLTRRLTMKIDLSSPNPALESIFKHPEQIITLDANFLIPPDRSRYARRSFDLPLFQRVWLEPVFKAFSNLAIHEAVYDELVMPSLAVKRLLYFAAHDSNALQLIEQAENWSTGLDNVQAIKMYELIFYLYKTGAADKQALRMLYKYQ